MSNTYQDENGNTQWGRRRKGTTHLKSPQYPYSTLCGQSINSVPTTNDRTKVNCVKCKEALEAYR
jgi:predicted SprT family Zn-dependent metalloprotease